MPLRAPSSNAAPRCRLGEVGGLPRARRQKEAHFELERKLLEEQRRVKELEGALADEARRAKDARNAAREAKAAASAASTLSDTLKERMQSLEQRADESRTKFDALSRSVARMEEEKARIQQLASAAHAERERAEATR